MSRSRFLLSGPLSNVKHHWSRATGVWCLVRSLQPASWNKGWTRRRVALATGRASHQQPPAHAASRPQRAHWPRGKGRRLLPAGLACVLGPLPGEAVPSPSDLQVCQEHPRACLSRELPLIFGKTGTCGQVTSVTDCAGGTESRPQRGDDPDSRGFSVRTGSSRRGGSQSEAWTKPRWWP